MRDETGDILNEYRRVMPTVGNAPATPWAMYLADDDGFFHYLGFDFDATPSKAVHGRADHHSFAFGQTLDDLGIAHVIAQSGPNGGHHVWIALAEPVPAEDAQVLASLVGHIFPTLDKSQLTNPATGCLRPPLSPHRMGGFSEIRHGFEGTLVSPTTTRDQIAELIVALSREAGAAYVVDTTREPLHALTDGPVPRLDVPKRPLSDKTASLISFGDPGNRDHSAVLFSTLLGLVHAGWSFSEVAAIATTSPAFEHIRTRAHGATRKPRSHRAQAELLERQWQKAVATAATHTSHRIPMPHRFDLEAAAAVIDLVQAIQQKAHAMPGRWTNGTGYAADRAVLDALTLIALRSLRPAVDASTRELAALTGYGRETVRVALLRLTEDGWITRTRSHEGTNAPTWELSTTPMTQDWAQKEVTHPRPLRGLWTALVTEMAGRLESAAHDVFAAPHSLGRVAGSAYAHLPTSGALATTAEIARAAGLSVRSTRRSLRLLASHGLAHTHVGQFSRPDDDARTQVAVLMGVHGYLEERAQRYQAERDAFSWWLVDQTMKNKRHYASRPSPFLPQLVELEEEPALLPRYPRRRNGRADYTTAHELVRSGRLSHPNTPVLTAVRRVRRASVGFRLTA